jgi:hypothetical protein
MVDMQLWERRRHPGLGEAYQHKYRKAVPRGPLVRKESAYCSLEDLGADQQNALPRFTNLGKFQLNFRIFEPSYEWTWVVLYVR